MTLDIVLNRLWTGYYSTRSVVHNGFVFWFESVYSPETICLKTLVRDVDLIWSNATLYFKNTSLQYDDALHLSKKKIQQWQTSFDVQYCINVYDSTGGIFHERVEELRKIQEKADKVRKEKERVEWTRVINLEDSEARKVYENYKKQYTSSKQAELIQQAE